MFYIIKLLAGLLMQGSAIVESKVSDATHGLFKSLGSKREQEHKHNPNKNKRI